MMLQKRLDYGFSGYQVPPTPRATRSARRRGMIGTKRHDNQMCAFDLLATVAGKLLSDGEVSPDSVDAPNVNEQSTFTVGSIKKEHHDNDHPMTERSCDRDFFSSELVTQAPVLNDSPDEHPQPQIDICSRPASVITTSESSGKVCDSKIGLGGSNIKADVNSPGTSSCKIEGKTEKQTKIKLLNKGKVSVNTADTSSSEIPVTVDSKPSGVVSVENNSVNFPLSRYHSHCDPFLLNRGSVKVVSRDDDENSARCNQPSSTSKDVRPSPSTGDRRIRNLQASNYWKVSPKPDNDVPLKADGEINRHAYHNQNNFYKRQRSLRDYPLKKRRLYACNSVSCSDGGISSDGICSSPAKIFDENSSGSGSGSTFPGVTRRSTSVVDENAAIDSNNSHVNFKIKSFRIPELLIEIPETATVGSLKRTVMEAVTAILEGGLHIGVLFQGKKIRDDNKTLLQTGISHDNKHEALGFTLEPNPSRAAASHFREDRLVLHSDAPQPLNRYPPASDIGHHEVHRAISDTLHDHRAINFSNLVESDHDSAPSPPDMSMEKSAADSRALVAVPPMNAEALSVVPMRKPKRAESSQRRIRRPFSVSEVEALVQAVEKLGTGRWRDVKLRAFDNAKHRTYVDLKDKWKTLVHTARISPQQRRGEPVPQELLDRVLTAHAYWSQQQAKQQLKRQTETCLLL